MKPEQLKGCNCHLLSKWSGGKAYLEDAEFGSGHLKSETPVNTLVEILNWLEFKKCTLETHVGAVSIRLVFKTLALGEITKQMNTDQEEERIS